MNFRIPSTPEQWIQLAGPVAAAIAAILALVGISVGVGSSDNTGSSAKSRSTVTATATAVTTETVVAPTTVTATIVSTTTLSPTSATTTTSSSEEPTPTGDQPVLNKFEDNVLETAKERYEIVKVEVLSADAPGNLGDHPIIVYTYEFTNKDSKNAKSQWPLSFTAIQDNDPNFVNELRPAMYLDSGVGTNALRDVKPKGKIRASIAYQLTDTETPVTLKASNPIGSVQYGEQTYPIK